MRKRDSERVWEKEAEEEEEETIGVLHMCVQGRVWRGVYINYIKVYINI